MNRESLIQSATRIVERSREVVVFTGAGVSAESGIPTYRGDGGMWKEYDAYKVVEINAFLEEPTYFWSFFRDVRYRALVDSEPNPAHLAIAELQRRGKASAVVTQNIDGLHRLAGSSDVIELHGNTRRIDCLDCGAEYDFDDIHQKVQRELPPRCDECGGLLKPRVTFFGEPLPAGAMETAIAAAAACDLMLVVGSTLEVFPAASVPLVAKRGDAAMIIVNVGATAMDEMADVKIDAPAGEVLPEILGVEV
jgi:NAD-dependent deacetylase